MSNQVRSEKTSEAFNETDNASCESAEGIAHQSAGVGLFWGTLWGLLFGAAFFWIPGIGPIAA